jgi:hypothetical protein
VDSGRPWLTVLVLLLIADLVVIRIGLDWLGLWPPP